MSRDSKSAGGAFEVLIVDDDPGDVLLIEEALAERRLHHRLHTAGDGVLALEFLRDSAQPRPDLILLDLNMPRMNGRELLGEVKADPALRAIPVVVLSTSAVTEDVTDSYGLRANAYVTKPVDFDDFVATVQHIDDFYLGVVRLPRSPGSHTA
ncbi:response regulator [Cryptosporangium phraense]|uniref:response regulator n=1 Tax=Cryptosporangium phraense TaxID=2593070 RepID=UPI001F0F2B35|nr:response regulator [Cryptosporangium phraense]